MGCPPFMVSFLPEKSCTFLNFAYLSPEIAPMSARNPSPAFMYNLPVDGITKFSLDNHNSIIPEKLFATLFERMQAHIGRHLVIEKDTSPMLCRSLICTVQEKHFHEPAYNIRLHKQSKVCLSVYYMRCMGLFYFCVVGETPCAYPEDPHQYLYYVGIYHFVKILLEEKVLGVRVVPLFISAPVYKLCATAEDMEDYFDKVSESESYTYIKDFIISPYEEAKKTNFPACWHID
jgi:hypothetical protein